MALHIHLRRGELIEIGTDIMISLPDIDRNPRSAKISITAPMEFDIRHVQPDRGRIRTRRGNEMTGFCQHENCRLFATHEINGRRLCARHDEQERIDAHRAAEMARNHDQLSRSLSAEAADSDLGPNQATI